MNPLPAIQNACAIIDKSLGKYADEAKREAAWGIVRDLCEKWRPVHLKDSLTITPPDETPIENIDVRNLEDVPAEYAPANSAMHAAIAEVVAMGALIDKEISSDPAGPMAKAAAARVEAYHQLSAYPATATVKIQGMCPNPRLMAGALPDGRKVSVWTCRGRQFRLHADVACKLDVVRGDEAIYLPL